MLIGHLAADPDLRTTDTGVSIATFPVATNRDWKTSDGEKKEAVDYHKIVAWRNLASICAQHLVKGSPVFVEGRLQNSSFEDKDGNKKFVTETVLEKLNILVYKKEKGSVEMNVKDVTDEKNGSDVHSGDDKKSSK